MNLPLSIEHLMAGETQIVAIVLVSAFMAAFAQYIFKKNMPRFSANLKGLIGLAANRRILLGVGIYMASLVVYLYALRSSELSFVYPTFASVFVFVLILSKFSLGEEITLHRIIGVAIVIAGIIIVALTY